MEVKTLINILVEFRKIDKKYPDKMFATDFISERIGLPRNTTSNYLKKLENQGYIYRPKTEDFESFDYYSLNKGNLK